MGDGKLHDSCSLSLRDPPTHRITLDGKAGGGSSATTMDVTRSWAVAEMDLDCDSPMILDETAERVGSQRKGRELIVLRMHGFRASIPAPTPPTTDAANAPISARKHDRDGTSARPSSRNIQDHLAPEMVEPS